MAETPKGEEREIDLTIGFNKQLISIVFIIFVLFGVVFSMGYFVGRATSNGDAQMPAAAKAADANAQAKPEAMGPETAKPPSAAPAETAPEQPLEPGEGKVTDAAAAQPAPAAEVASAPVAAPPKPVEQPKPAPPAPLPAAAAGAPAGTFLQVAAVKREQALMLQDVLKEKGFQTAIVPVTVGGQELFRTLVGPLKDASDIAKTKAQLESAGFKPIVKKF